MKTPRTASGKFASRKEPLKPYQDMANGTPEERWLAWLADGAPAKTPPNNVTMHMWCQDCDATLRCLAEPHRCSKGVTA